MDLDKLLSEIAIEEAPAGLIEKWKLQVKVREREPVWDFQWLYISLPVMFSLAFAYFAIFKREMLFSFELDKVVEPLQEFLTYVGNFTGTSIYVNLSIVISIFIAGVSLLWFFYNESRSRVYQAQ